MTIPAPTCTQCGDPTDGKARTLCASCRRKAKVAALQANRAQNMVTVRINQLPGPSMGVPPQLTGGTGPRCLSCGSPREVGQALCHACQLTCSQTALRIYAHRLSMTRPSFANATVGCFVCGEAVPEGTLQLLGCTVCHRCQNYFSENEVRAMVTCQKASGHRVDCECDLCRGKQAQRMIEVTEQHSRHAIAPPPFATGGLYPRLPSASARGTMLFSLPPGIISYRGGSPLEKVNLDNADPDRVPDLIEPVLAWRGWNVTPDGHLVAAMQDGIWDPGENQAICHRGHHTDIPAEGCSCGLYGWHRPSQIAHGAIHGAIKCRGEVIVHDVGVRAEYAEIICIVEAPGSGIVPEQLARIVDRYKVPVFGALEEAEEYASTRGVRVPESMRPRDAEQERNERMLTSIQAAAISAGQALATSKGMAASMAKVGQSLRATPQTMQQFADAVRQAEEKQRSKRARFWSSVCIGVAGLALWTVLAALVPTLPGWTGFPAGVVISYGAFFSSAPEIALGIARWLRRSPPVDFVLYVVFGRDSKLF